MHHRQYWRACRQLARKVLSATRHLRLIAEMAQRIAYFHHEKEIAFQPQHFFGPAHRFLSSTQRRLSAENISPSQRLGCVVSSVVLANSFLRASTSQVP